mgnify:CR=1 FL=1
MARNYDSDDRNMWDRAGDEVRSWFGDDEAERRRRFDQLRAERERYMNERSQMGRYHQERSRDHYRGDGYGRNEYRGGQGRTDRPGVADDEFERDWGMRESAGGAGAANPWSGPRYDHRVRGSGWLPEYGGPRDPWGEGPAYGRSGGREHESFAGRGPSGYRRADERIAEEVNEALTWDWRLDATDIMVSVEGGDVTLSGTVRDRRSKRRAEDLADDVRGVNDVQNQLRIHDPRKTELPSEEQPL